MKLGAAAVTVLAAAACSNLPENNSGIATLEVRLPANAFLEVGREVRLTAVARNRDGDSVAADIAWRTPDTTITVDSAQGIVTALFATGRGRIQVALAGESDFASGIDNLALTLTGAADTLISNGPDSLDAADDATGASIGGLLLQGGDPPVPVGGRPIGFRIVEPVEGDSPTVSFGSGRTADSTTTQPTGSPVPITVRAAPGRRPPDRVVVEVRAHRASGEAIPGSPRRFVIRFLHQ